VTERLSRYFVNHWAKYYFLLRYDYFAAVIDAKRKDQSLG
jgi:hypothetical protein